MIERTCYCSMFGEGCTCDPAPAAAPVADSEVENREAFVALLLDRVNKCAAKHGCDWKFSIHPEGDGSAGLVIDHDAGFRSEYKLYDADGSVFAD